MYKQTLKSDAVWMLRDYFNGKKSLISLIIEIMRPCV